MPPASPQSSHFGSSGSSESQDHQTPTTELADGDGDRDADDEGELDYYLEGKSYLEENGYHLVGKHRERADAEEERRRLEWEEMQRRPKEPDSAKAKANAKAKPAPAPQKQPDERARMMVSATDTLGGAADPESPDGEEEYEYGYEFPEEGELREGAVDSPRDDSPRSGAYDSPRSGAFPSPLGPFGGGGLRAQEEEEEDEEDEEGTLGPKERAALELASAGDAIITRPTVITTRAVGRTVLSPGPLTALGLAQTPVTPAQRYAGWVAAAVAPLEDFIDEAVEPNDFYTDLQEIAEGESGSVYSAALIPTAPLHRLKLPPLVLARDMDDIAHGRRALVAIKNVALVPGGSQKLIDVQRECRLLRGLWCEQVLGMDALYVDLVDDALWIRMELMERSLADVVGLVDEGLSLQEPRVLARFASDVSLPVRFVG
jgi:hypothetical protein